MIPDLPTYQCHKKVQAAKIISIEEVNADTEAKDRINGANLTVQTPTAVISFYVDGAFMGRHLPKTDDYYVRYDDGYSSVSPAKAFEEGYTLIK